MIGSSLPAAGRVSLNVHNMLGQAVAVLLDEELPAGIYSLPFDAGHLTSGVYLYRLSVLPATQRDGQTGKWVQTRKFTLLR